MGDIPIEDNFFLLGFDTLDEDLLLGADFSFGWIVTLGALNSSREGIPGLMFLLSFLSSSKVSLEGDSKGAPEETERN